MQNQGRETTSNLISNNKRTAYFLIAVIIIVLDQVTKAFMSSWLSSGKVVKLFDGDLVWFVLVHNPGLAFGLRLLPTPVLAAFSLVAATALGYYLYRYPLPMSQGFPLGLIMGGAIGNMIDRMRLGQVVDFISVDFPDFWMSRWPVFNVADSAVSVGIVWIVLVTLLMPEVDSSELSDHVDELDSDSLPN